MFSKIELRVTGVANGVKAVASDAGGLKPRCPCEGTLMAPRLDGALPEESMHKDASGSCGSIRCLLVECGDAKRGRRPGDSASSRSRELTDARYCRQEWLPAIWAFAG